MSKKKTLLAVIACIVMAFSFCLAGCGSGSDDSAAGQRLEAMYENHTQNAHSFCHIKFKLP